MLKRQIQQRRATEIKIKEPGQIISDRMIEEHLDKHLYIATSPSKATGTSTKDGVVSKKSKVKVVLPSKQEQQQAGGGGGPSLIDKLITRTTVQGVPSAAKAPAKVNVNKDL